MTLETKFFLDLEDILAVHLRCSGCGISSLFPLSKLSHAPYECPHCRVDWVLPQTSEETKISAFLSSLKGISDAMRGRSFKLTLEIKAPGEDGSSKPLTPHPRGV